LSETPQFGTKALRKLVYNTNEGAGTMRYTLTGLSLLLIGTAALAQTTPPVPEAAAAPGTVAAPAAPPTPAEAAAAEKRAAEAEKQAEKSRAEAEKQAKAQQREAEKQREAAEKQAREQQKAQERAAAEAQKAEAARAAEAERAAAAKAQADAAAAAKAKADAEAAAALAAAQKSGDARDIATQVCLAEAKSRATAIGATNVTMNEVKDTDKKSDGRASVTAKVNIVTMNKGKPKVQTKKIECETRNGAVTKFKWN
jgi:hypothetical protein